MFCVKTATVALPGVLGRQTEPLSQKWPRAPISATEAPGVLGALGAPLVPHFLDVVSLGARSRAFAQEF